MLPAIQRSALQGIWLIRSSVCTRAGCKQRAESIPHLHLAVPGRRSVQKMHQPPALDLQAQLAVGCGRGPQRRGLLPVALLLRRGAEETSASAEDMRVCECLRTCLVLCGSYATTSGKPCTLDMFSAQMRS